LISFINLCYKYFSPSFKGELNKEEDRILVAEGGLGGKLLTNFLPLKGQKRVIHLDLKLIADVGLVG
jgi:GTPase involved in cell partitioning and DNA repair